MAGVTVKMDLSRAKAKLRRWERRADKKLLEDLKVYGETAAKAMIKCTPPSHKGTTPAKALKDLKARIKKDFEGDEEPYSDKDIYWVTIDGVKIARFYRKNGRPSPFRLLTERVHEKILRPKGLGRYQVNGRALHFMNYGRYGVDFIKHNLGGWIKSHPEQYSMGPTRRSYRFKWYGVRHITTPGAVRTEIRRRQHLAGKLMAGWKPFAKKVKVRLPAAAEKQSGAGTVKTRSSVAHKAVLEASNKGYYPGLQAIVDRQLPGIVKKNRALAKRLARDLAKKLK